MKKFTLLLGAFLCAIFLNAQVDRNLVLVEIATGTWCVYCPGSAMGADDLIDNGHAVAVIENHNGDPYANDDSNARNSYYGVSGYPTANFDGSYDNYVGGSNTQSMYDNYYPIVDARILMPTTHVMGIYGTHTGDAYSITVRVQKQGEYNSEDLKVRLALTESEIDVPWQGYNGLNFVNRLMAPDAEGTDISADDNGEIFDVELEFTFDNTWIASNCELVAFLQDDGNKEVLQTYKVALNSLIAPTPILSAGFESTGNDICTEGYITYNADISSPSFDYNWSFPGGTPSTSTESNPTVFYDSPGEYDVELTVSDGIFTAINLEENFMSVVLPVTTPDMPSGETVLCGNYFYAFEVPDDEYAASYTWELNPTSAGTFEWSNSVATLEAANDWEGDFTVRVMRSNFCGDSEWSEELQCTLSSSPNEYITEGGGGYCAESEGVEITVSDSDVGIDYELFMDGTSTGNIIAGTGSEINFGLQTEEGDYTVVGSNDNCTWQMMNQVEVFIMYAPIEPGTPEGPTAVCNNQITLYESAGNNEAESYIWALMPEEAGVLEVNGLNATVTWNSEFSGTATLSISGENECGIGNDAGLEIEIDAIPAPVIQGQSLVCDEQVEDYTTTGVDGNTYTWEVTGGTITDGQGTATVTVAWGLPGMGYLSVEEATNVGCFANSETIEVVIDDCTGIGENSLENSVRLQPNPAKDYVNIQSGNNIQAVQVYNLTGELVVNKTMNSTEDRINLAEYQAGIYLIRIVTDKGIVTKRLIVE